jgi:phosphoadenosine phosphosulfate reductase
MTQADAAPPITLRPLADPVALGERLGGLPADALLARLAAEHRGRIALVSSFGAEAAVLLHLVAGADQAMPVLFLDTGQLFPETLEHRDRLVRRLGLRDVRSIRPDPAEAAAEDPESWLWASDPDACCALRKTRPLRRALRDFDLWITGRKRYQAGTRAALPLFEREDGRVKVNPLAAWGAAEIEAYRRAHELPAHPLVAQGYPSIGCLPCTTRVRPGEDPRAGRWRGRAKVECGIHAATGPG